MLPVPGETVTGHIALESDSSSPTHDRAPKCASAYGSLRGLSTVSLKISRQRAQQLKPKLRLA